MFLTVAMASRVASSSVCLSLKMADFNKVVWNAEVDIIRLIINMAESKEGCVQISISDITEIKE